MLSLDIEPLSDTFPICKTMYKVHWLESKYSQRHFSCLVTIENICVVTQDVRKYIKKKCFHTALILKNTTDF